MADAKLTVTFDDAKVKAVGEALGRELHARFDAALVEANAENERLRAELAEARREQEKLATTGEWVVRHGYRDYAIGWAPHTAPPPGSPRPGDNVYRVEWHGPISVVEAGTTMEETT